MAKRKVKNGFDLYKAKDGWRWRLGRKGRIIAESGEAYKNEKDAGAGFISVCEFGFQLYLAALGDRKKGK